MLDDVYLGAVGTEQGPYGSRALHKYKLGRYNSWVGWQIYGHLLHFPVND